MEDEEWDIILAALDKYMKLYDLVQGDRKDFYRDRDAIQKLQKYINVGLGN